MDWRKLSSVDFLNATFSHIDRILYYGIVVQYSKLSGTHFTWSFQAAIAMYYLAISRSE